MTKRLYGCVWEIAMYAVSGLYPLNSAIFIFQIVSQTRPHRTRYCRHDTELVSEHSPMMR